MSKELDQERADFEALAKGYGWAINQYAGSQTYVDVRASVGWTAWQARASRSAMTVPTGWKLVPEEATEAMVEAGSRAFYAMPPRNSLEQDVLGYYKAMLAAAPAAPEAGWQEAMRHTVKGMFETNDHDADLAVKCTQAMLAAPSTVKGE